MGCLLSYLGGSLHEDATHLAHGSHDTAECDVGYLARSTHCSKDAPFATRVFLAFLLLLLWLFTTHLPSSAGLYVMGGDVIRLRIRGLS